MTEAPGTTTETVDRVRATLVARPPIRPIAGWWDFFVRGVRPAIAWVCILAIFVEMVVLRIAALFGALVLPLNFGEVAALLVPILVHYASRHIEKRMGLTS